MGTRAHAGAGASGALSRRARARRWSCTVAALLCAGVLAVPGARAQAPDAYVDRTIEGLTDEPADDNAAPPRDDSGWPRYLRLEARWGQDTVGATGTARPGLAAFGLLETPNHGTLSIDAQHAPGGGSTFTLRQRGMPLGGGWRADHDVGLVPMATPDLLRQPGRVFLPSATVIGLAGQWRQEAGGLQGVASVGQAGRLALSPATRVERLPGQRASLGLQWRPATAASVPGARAGGGGLAWLHEQASGVGEGSQPLADAASDLVAWRHEDGPLQVQGQWLNTRQSDVDGTRQGWWVDAQWSQAAWQHSAGLYRLEPGLSWARQPLPNDLMGGYGRSRWRSRAVSVEGSIDLLRSVSGLRVGGYYATGTASWRIDRDHRMSAGAAIRDYAGRGWNAFADWRWRQDDDDNGLRVDIEGGAARERALRLTHDRQWAMPVGWSLATTLGLARIGADAASGTPADLRWRAAASLAMPLGSNASLRGTLETEQGRHGLQRHAVNLGVNWRIRPAWSLEGTVVLTRGRMADPVPLDPLAPVPLLAQTLNSRTLFVALRHEFEAGSRSVPLGGRASEGGGAVAGEVFYDANRNGTREAGEGGVPNATVFLDNRYAVRTDAQGRFEFGFVAVGTHTVTLANESLPLPWNAPAEAAAPVEVRLRERIALQLGVQRAD